MRQIYISFLLLFLYPISLQAQNVGIGEASPATKLSIKGNTGNDLLNVKDDGGMSRMYVTETGEVGIGTTNPSGPLNVVGSNSQSSNGIIEIDAGGSADLRIGVNTGYSWIQSHGSLPLYINELGNDVILSQSKNGNVGIGTSSPTSLLDINGNLRIRNGATANHVLTSDADGNASWQDPNGLVNETDPVWTNDKSNYYTKGNLQTSGQSSVHWNNLTNVPSGLNDGDDDNQTLSISNEYNLNISNGNTVRLEHLRVTDTRSANEAPTNFNKEVAFDFKDRGAVGVPGSGTYSGMITIAPWSDNSGDAHHQINVNEGGMYWRQGQPNNSFWGSWQEIWTEGTDGSNSGLDADLLDGQDASYYLDNTDNQDLSDVLSQDNSAGSNNINMNSPAQTSSNNSIENVASVNFVNQETSYVADEEANVMWDNSEGLMFYHDGAWRRVMDNYINDEGLLDILATGNSAGSDNINMNNNKITNLSNPTSGQDAVNKRYLENKYWDKNTFSFTVGGTTSDFYPVLLDISGEQDAPVNFVIHRSDVHQDGSWKGSFAAQIKFWAKRYGNTNTSFTVDYLIGTGDNNQPLADVADGSGKSGNAQIVLWVKGGLTYNVSTHNGGVSIDDKNSGGGTVTDNSGNTRSSISSRNLDGNYVHFLDQGLTTEGNIGVKTSSPNSALEVNGQINSNGITETSDARMKKDVEQLQDAISKVEQLRGVSYNWRQDEFPKKEFEDDKQIGVIAQEVEEVLPEVVHTDKEGYKSVEYSHLTPVLIEAVKELSAENRHQDRALQAKTERIEALENELQKYKQVMDQVDTEQLLEDYGKAPASAEKRE